jgi:hypothetical protein
MANFEFLSLLRIAGTIDQLKKTPFGMDRGTFAQWTNRDGEYDVGKRSAVFVFQSLPEINGLVAASTADLPREAAILREMSSSCFLDADI